MRKQRMPTTDEAERLIEDGWQYVGTLPNGKVVVKKIGFVITVRGGPKVFVHT